MLTMREMKWKQRDNGPSPKPQLRVSVSLHFTKQGTSISYCWKKALCLSYNGKGILTLERMPCATKLRTNNTTGSPGIKLSTNICPLVFIIDHDSSAGKKNTNRCDATDGMHALHKKQNRLLLTGMMNLVGPSWQGGWESFWTSCATCMPSRGPSRARGAPRSLWEGAEGTSPSLENPASAACPTTAGGKGFETISTRKLKFAQPWQTDCCWCNNQKRKRKKHH